MTDKFSERKFRELIAARGHMYAMKDAWECRFVIEERTKRFALRKAGTPSDDWDFEYDMLWDGAKEGYDVWLVVPNWNLKNMNRVDPAWERVRAGFVGGYGHVDDACAEAWRNMNDSGAPMSFDPNDPGDLITLDLLGLSDFVLDVAPRLVAWSILAETQGLTLN